MTKVYVMPDPNESKFKRFVRRTKEKVRNAGEWLIEKPERLQGLITIVGIGVPLLTAGVKAVGKRVNLRKQQEVKELYCYDASLGHYWKLRRELSNKEWLEIDSRKRDGERLGDILNELKVLK